MYIADGDYIKDIEVNDLRNRYTLTKGATQKMVNIPIISTDTPRSLFSVFILGYDYDVSFLLPLWENILSLHWAD